MKMQGTKTSQKSKNKNNVNDGNINNNINSSKDLHSKKPIKNAGLEDDDYLDNTQDNHSNLQHTEIAGNNKYDENRKFFILSTIIIVFGLVVFFGTRIYYNNVFPDTAIVLPKDKYKMIAIDKNGDTFFTKQDGTLFKALKEDRIVEKRDRYIIIRPEDRKKSRGKWWERRTTDDELPIDANNFQKAKNNSMFGGWR